MLIKELDKHHDPGAKDINVKWESIKLKAKKWWIN